MPGNFNDNDQTKLYRADSSDDQPTFKRRPYPQPQQQYQNGQQNDTAPPLKKYMQGGYQNQTPYQQQNMFARPQQQQQYQQPQYQQPQYQPRQPQYQQPQYQQQPRQPQPQYRQPAGQYPHRPAEEKKEKGSSGIIILLIITLLFILGVVAGGIYMYLKDNGSGGSKKDSSDTSSSEDVTASQRPGAEENTLPADDDSTEKVSVPDVRGSDQLTAEIELEQAGLKCETEFQFSDTINEGIVISQSIPAETEADEGTVVTIVVSQGKSQGDKVIVPNVTGRDYKEAYAELTRYQLNVSAKYVPHDKFAKDVVISQDIAPGTEVYAGSKIELTVSQGKDSQQVTTSPAEDDSKKYGYVNTAETDLNVRQGPSTDSERIGSLQKGKKMEIVGSEGNWYKIVYEDGYGYVSKDYVKLID